MVNSIVEKIKLFSQQHPDKICLADDKGSLTYIQTWNSIVSIAQYLKEKVSESGLCIVVECTQDSQFLLYGLAIQLAGHIFVPIEKGCSVERITSIIEETNCKYYISTTNVNSSAERLLLPTSLTYNEDWKYAFPSSNQTAEILFTTGTTGKSKGILITHANNVAISENVIYGVEMKPDNVELIPMPLSHSHGLRRFYANMLNGCTVVIMDGVTFFKSFFDNIDTYQVTAIDLAPSALDILLKFSKNKLADYSKQIDYIQLGGAPLKEESKLRLCELLPHTRLYNFYGSTEAGCSCILNFNKENKPHCIGHPTIHSQFIIVNSDKEIIQSDSMNTGYLACKGPMNMLGYYKQPSLTSSVMNNGYVYSNDIGYIDEQGYIYILGRDDDVINYCGIKISPEEIENITLRIPEIIDCACIPIEDKLGGQAPKLYVVTKNGTDFSSISDSIYEYLMEHLDKNKIPKIIEPIDAIPRTYNGKILRRELKLLK